MNLVHDPRWGRAQEVYSEDPKLSSDLTIAIVTGMQDNKVGSVVGSDGHIMSAACCKRKHAELGLLVPLPLSLFHI